MKTKHILQLAATTLLLILNHPLSTVFAQGSLTPPGAPAPTMKSLDQVEPRMPISSAPFTITQPGSYYLTANLNVTSGDAIDINTNGVTLDLNGFTISSTEISPSGTGIMLAGGNIDIIILNGHIKGGVTNNAGIYSGNGFAAGIRFYPGSAVPSNVRVSGVSVSGCQVYGILLDRTFIQAGSSPVDQSTVVESCTVQTIGAYGIYAGSVCHSMAYQCGSQAISAYTASDCVGQGNGGVGAFTANNCYGYGVAVGLSANNANNCYGKCTGNSIADYGLDADTANNCEGYSQYGYGLYAQSAHNCYGSSFTTDGIHATSCASDCYGRSFGGGIGVYAGATAQNCNGVSDSGTGVYAVRSAIGCDGESVSGTGLYVYTGVTMGSFGYSSTGLGLQAYVATGCYGQNGSGTSEVIAWRYNMP